MLSEYMTCGSAKSGDASGSGRPYGELVAAQGLSDGHWMMIDAVAPGARVLDVGCASGYLARELRSRGSTVVGIEPDAVTATEARTSCEAVIVGDFERPEDREQLPAPFDYVLFGDVLEHLRDPWAALGATHELLRPAGRVIVSIPNIAHWSARREILRGRFPYADHGLFDRTHLRFFTRETAYDLVTSAGYAVEHEDYTRWRLPFERRIKMPENWQPEAARRWPELFALQFVMTLRRADGDA